MKIKGNFEYGENYDMKFVNGIFGGTTVNNQEVILNFYFENIALPESYELEIDEDGNILKTDFFTNEDGMNRKVEAGVIMNLDTAKSLYEWLGSTINNMELDLEVE
ncbi:hypothetical protein SAMN02910355_1831 [Terrisporobacter glycolicus]|nr:hypothetical protein SAMN02910355_1831 [Terrisporobacter glycolicus]